MLAILLLVPGGASGESPVVNVYNWADYIGPTTLADFEAETGIHVNYDEYDSSEIVEAKLLAGHTGYDVVVHGGQYASRLIPLGIFRPLDRSRLAGWKDLDPEVLAKLAGYDPGNVYAAPYMWGSAGVAYNVKMVRERMPDAPVDSGAMIFDPEVVSKFADCGVSILDSPTDVIPMALVYLGFDGNSTNPDDIDAAEKMLSSVRPYIRYFSSTRLLTDMPNDEICVAMSWSGDYAVARERAAEVGIDIDLAYSVPKEGSFFWFDGLFIPSDAPHPDAAMRFIEFLLRPNVMAAVTNQTRYANAVVTSQPFIEPEILSDPAVYPDQRLVSRLGLLRALPPKAERRRTRAFARFKAGTSAPWLDSSIRPFVRIEAVTKRFGNFTAVDRVDLDIYSRELFAILGASGCGKSTLLRIIAGLETPDSGAIFIDGVDVTHLPPYERPVNIMFQSYALFPHMTVEQNVAYGLRRGGVSKQETASRVEKMLALVKLSELARAKPAQISGGQSQRVALARALVKRPKALLLDEPLAALDKKLREETQFELANVQDELGVTFIVVTHDQEEAMTLATRIAVMNAGRFVQVGTPGEIYEHPSNRFVADFVGKINLLEGVVADFADGNPVVRCNATPEPIVLPHDGTVARGDSVCVAVRPEKIYITKEAPEEAANRTVIRGVVFDLAYFGNLSLYRVKTEGGKVIDVSAQNRRREARRYLEWDDQVYLSWDNGSALLLTD